MEGCIDFKALTDEIGPAYDITDIFPELNEKDTRRATWLSWLSNGFAVTGFNRFRGESFVLASYLSTDAHLTGGGKGETMSPLPLPATIWLLLCGLGALGLRGRALRG